MAKSTIGLKNLLAWEMLTDEDGGTTTYGPAVELAGAINATITPDTSEADVQYADDVEYDSVAPDTPYTMEIEIAGMSIANQAKLQGHKLDTNGGMIIKDGDEPPYFAFAFKSQISDAKDVKYRYVVIYKGKPEFMTRAYHTKEGTTLTRQTATMTVKAVARISDGLKQYVSDTEPTGFLTSPYKPTAAGL